MVNGFVNADPGFAQTTLVLNPFSDLIVDVFGPDIGVHARTAIGVATVPSTCRSSCLQRSSCRSGSRTDLAISRRGVLYRIGRAAAPYRANVGVSGRAPGDRGADGRGSVDRNALVAHTAGHGPVAGSVPGGRKSDDEMDDARPRRRGGGGRRVR